MASGIEVAGLVLGVIPIVISALESYEDFLGPTKAFMKYHGELPRLTRQLVNYYTSYEQSIQILLRPIAEQHELLDMVENVGSELWKDKEIEEKLQIRLGRSYSAYMSVVKDIERSMKSVAEHLNIEGTDRITKEGLGVVVAAYPPITQHGKPTKFEFRKRIKFTMKRQKIKELLEDVTVSINELDRYLEKAERLEEPYRAERKSKFVDPIGLMKQNATRLWDILARTWCSSHPTHSAGLLLEQRLVSKKRKGTSCLPREQSTKDYSRHFGVSLLQARSTKKWLEVEFCIVETPTLEISRSSKVQFLVSPPGPTAPPSSTAVLPYADPSQLQVVTNLCSVIQKPSHPWIGFCVCDDGCLRGAYSTHDRCIAYMENSLSLDQILCTKSCSLSKEEMYSLAITLTSSLLQLGRTPWLQQTWDKADIMFLRATNGSSVKVDLKHPYLRREHRSTHVQPIRQPGDDCSKILALGTMLLEICSGQSIETFRRPEDFGPDKQPNELSNLSTARHWLLEQKANGDISLAFYSAISHCLKCFVDPTASLENIELARTIEEQVLAPLEEEQNNLLLGPLSG